MPDQIACLTCHHWKPPPPPRRAGKAQTKPGHCSLDNAASHAAYACDKHAFKAELLIKMFGITQDELRWLRAHPDDPRTQYLRRGLELVRASKGADHDRALFAELLGICREHWHPSRVRVEQPADGDLALETTLDRLLG